MKYFVVVIISFLSFQFSVANTYDNEQYWMFRKWVDDFKKVYNTTKEEQVGWLNFVDNLSFIRSRRNNHFKNGLNGFADMNRTEFHHTRNRAIVVEYNITADETPQYPERRKRRSTAPLSLDWGSTYLHAKYLQPIRDQGQCGSCWAFAATSVLESRTAIKNVTWTVGLSAQNLADCVYDRPRDGCNGGWPTEAFESVRKYAGQNTEGDYPYSSGTSRHTGTCGYNKTKTRTTLIRAEQVPKQNQILTDQQLMELLVDGPVVAAIDASDMMLYIDGIYRCVTFNGVNHAVVVVGYGGTTDKLDAHWIVRNSWGTWWGNNGYFKLSRNPAYNCGVTLYIMYPIL